MIMLAKTKTKGETTDGNLDSDFFTDDIIRISQL
jgi:hypothetical protein